MARKLKKNISSFIDENQSTTQKCSDVKKKDHIIDNVLTTGNKHELSVFWWFLRIDSSQHAREIEYFWISYGYLLKTEFEIKVKLIHFWKFEQYFHICFGHSGEKIRKIKIIKTGWERILTGFRPDGTGTDQAEKVDQTYSACQGLSRLKNELFLFSTNFHL